MKIISRIDNAYVRVLYHKMKYEEGYLIFLAHGNKNPIGHIYKDEYGWNSEYEYSDIGHGCIESMMDAIRSVVSIHHEALYHASQKEIRR